MFTLATQGLISMTEEGEFELIDCPTGPVINMSVRAQNYATLEMMKVDAAAASPI